jgi:hypothetical protein
LDHEPRLMLATRSRPSLTIMVHSHSRDRVLLGMTDTNPLLPADEGQCVVGFLTFPEARTAALALLGLAGVEGNDGPVLDLPIDQLLWRRAEYLRSLPYPEYLLTRHWRCCRRRAIERAKGTCQACNATEGLNVHHRTYERYGEEADAGLIALCRSCHRLFHEDGKLAKPRSSSRLLPALSSRPPTRLSPRPRDYGITSPRHRRPPSPRAHTPRGPKAPRPIAPRLLRPMGPRTPRPSGLRSRGHPGP